MLSDSNLVSPNVNKLETQKVTFYQLDDGAFWSHPKEFVRVFLAPDSSVINIQSNGNDVIVHSVTSGVKRGRNMFGEKPETE